ncbi:cysteine methyltransferase [Brachybacterium vulturis]|uniref:Cysteine methyltransferase n=1 Tax=Brachybacterium vulturis TaxID=2017484 RepID=A0A291GRJ3_9MICO|nr:MGMT family protein [Brachybacterium vulturis]ATG52969.1 cysteine methyltransferase [Brachybacterium vulturis]
MEDPREAVRAVAVTLRPGQVMTYGDIAVLTGLHPRQVGRHVADLEDIPWWRIVRADGTPATCHGGTAPALLAQEQVPFRGRRVDLRALSARPAPGPDSPPGGTA